MKARKRPVVVEFRRIDSMDYDGMLDIVRWCGGRAVGEEENEGKSVIAIDTLEGTMYADPGDIVIQGVKGEFYPCKPDVFAATYEVIEDAPVAAGQESWDA